MDARLKEIIWYQFGASFDMLEDAVAYCPDQLWTAVLWDDPEDGRYGQFWGVASHVLRWTDLYLTGPQKLEDFEHPAPFNRWLPEKPYAKGEVQTYLKACRQKGQGAIGALTDERAHEICTWEQPYLDLQLMSVRHVQEHASQLGLLLGQNGVSGPDWVGRARD